MYTELLILGLYAVTGLCIVVWKVSVLKYRETQEASLTSRLDALEAKSAAVSPEDWETIKKEIAGLRVANGLRTRR